MARSSMEDLEYCRMKNECLECYSLGQIRQADTSTKRGNLGEVPVCRPHFNACCSKVSQRNRAKGQRRAEDMQEAGLCVQSGCHNKMIPQELLPPGIRRRTCGLPHLDRLCDVKRAALCSFIAERYLTPEQRREMKAQSIVLAPKSGFAFYSLQTPWYYLTKVFLKSDLLEQHEEFQRQNPGLLAALLSVRNSVTAIT